MDAREVLLAVVFAGGMFGLLRLRMWSVRQSLRHERMQRPPLLDVDFELHYRPRRRELTIAHVGRVVVHDVEIWVGWDTSRPADHTREVFEPGEVIELPFDPDVVGVRLVREQVQDEWDSYLDLQVELRSRRDTGAAERDTWPRAYVA